MSPWLVLLALVLGFGAGVLSGLFGVGGGILFVPTLLALGLGQVEAAATSLLAIVPTAAVGTSRHRASGTLRPRMALVVGVASVAGVAGGVELATRLDETWLRRGFALLLLGVAAQLVVGANRRYAGRP